MVMVHQSRRLKTLEIRIVDRDGKNDHSSDAMKSSNFLSKILKVTEDSTGQEN